MQTKDTVQALITRVEYPFRRFVVGAAGGALYVQVVYDEDDVTAPGVLQEQRGRKWMVSPFATDSEVFQTLLAAVLASAEHQVREHFEVDGQSIYGPHMDANELVALLRARDVTDARRAA